MKIKLINWKGLHLSDQSFNLWLWILRSKKKTYFISSGFISAFLFIDIYFGYVCTLESHFHCFRLHLVGNIEVWTVFMWVVGVGEGSVGLREMKNFQTGGIFNGGGKGRGVVPNYMPCKWKMKNIVNCWYWKNEKPKWKKYQYLNLTASTLTWEISFTFIWRLY